MGMQIVMLQTLYMRTSNSIAYGEVFQERVNLQTFDHRAVFVVKPSSTNVPIVGEVLIRHPQPLRLCWVIPT